MNLEHLPPVVIGVLGLAAAAIVYVSYVALLLQRRQERPRTIFDVEHAPERIEREPLAEGLECAKISGHRGIPIGTFRPSRDETWLRVAEIIAQRGTCPRRQVGCVIVDIHGRVMATGYNGVASGRPHCSEGEPCPGAHFPSGQGLDKCEAIHAEQNACLLLSDPWKVDTVYTTASPCLSCVKLLLGTSAKRIVCRELYPHPDAIEWWRRAGRTIELLRPRKED